MLRKKYHVVRKKNHVVRKLFYVASIFSGAAGRKSGVRAGKKRMPWKKVPTAGKKVPTAACDFSFGARRFRRRDGGERTQTLGLPFFTLCRKKGGAAGGWRFALPHPMQKAERTPLRCLSAVLRAREGGCYALWGHGHRGRAVVQRGLISKLRSAGRSLPSQPSSCRWH